MADYYDTLGIKKGASESEIKKAYRQKAKQYHPDVNKGAGAEAKFKEVNEAYETLGDAKKRAAYDQFGKAGVGGNGAGGFGGFNPGDFAGNVNFDFGGVGDVFSEFFGGGMRQNSQQRQQGRDLEVVVTLDFLEAVFGTTKSIMVEKLAKCETCGGSGSKSGSGKTKCTTCNGTGQIRRVQQTVFGNIATNTTCPECGGEGQIIKEKCPTCQGEGRVRRREKIDLEIPAGVDDGMQLRFRGKGEVGRRGATAGDLYVSLRVKRSTKWQRDGYDIQTVVEIPLSVAVLGGKVEVETIRGKVKKLKIPAGTASQQVLRMTGEGIPKPRGGTGEHYVTVMVKIPKKVSKSDRELFEKLGQAGY